MEDSKRLAALKARMNNDVYVRNWQTTLSNSCCARPGFCCYATWCAQCASYQLRKQALHGDMRRYICCNGACPCSGRMGESSNPELCLCLEVWCCFAQSVASTRFMIQDELRLETTPCDNCIIGTMIALQYLACVCQIVACVLGSDELASLAQLIDCLADIVWCTVCACMQTQHKVEMDVRDANPASIPPPLPAMAPAVQMIPTQGPPPPGGYGYPPPPPGVHAPASAYGAPAPGYGAHPAPGYAAQAYAPGTYPPPGAYPPPGSYPPPPPGSYPPPPPGSYPPPPPGHSGYPQPPGQPQMYK